MEKEFKNIEDLFKSKFEDYQVQPSDKLWNNIDSKLKIRRFLNSGLSKLFGLSVTVAIITLAIINFKSNDIVNKVSEQKNIEKSSITKDIPVQNNKDKDIGNQSSNAPFVDQALLKLDKVGHKNEAEREKEFAPIIISKSIKQIENSDAQIQDEQINLAVPSPPVPVFSLDAKDGCAPFTVKIKNLSKAAFTYEWDFGDGNQSNDFMPQHTYRYPGIYRISLKAKGIGGTAVSYIDSVIVHEQANADIQWPYENELLTGQKIQIPNYSKNIAKVEWNFGDEHFSHDKNGQHIFKQKGEYTICMKIWSENGCVDSAVINNIKVVDINEKIVFPNAFTPNMDGPVSGYYNPADVYNDVFYPKYKGEIEEYELRIFSKFGVEVFKSNDVSYGWNGYYHNRLMPEDVYVYIVHGKFEGNQKFSFKGDVTLLHKNK